METEHVNVLYFSEGVYSSIPDSFPLLTITWFFSDRALSEYEQTIFLLKYKIKDNLILGKYLHRYRGSQLNKNILA